LEIIAFKLLKEDYFAMEMKDLGQNGLDNVKRTLDRTLDGLTAEELKWEPKPDANSIGLILFHMIGIEDSMVHRI
jgi:hypothetical protein